MMIKCARVLGDTIVIGLGRSRRKVMAEEVRGGMLLDLGRLGEFWTLVLEMV